MGSGGTSFSCRACACIGAAANNTKVVTTFARNIFLVSHRTKWHFGEFNRYEGRA